MKLSRMTAALVAAVISLPLAAEPHIGLTPHERFLTCAQSILGKPLLWHPDTPDLGSSACVRSRAALERAARDQDLTLVDRKTFAYLVPARLTKPSAAWWRVDLEHLTFRPVIRNAGDADSLTREQLDDLSTGILRSARLVAVTTRGGAPEEQTSNLLPFEMLIVARTEHEGMRDVFAIIRTNDDTEDGRVVYGVLRGNRYQFLWDSPLLNVRHATIQFADLDGDTHEEIVIRGETAGEREWMTLTAFDTNGNEVTRQPGCAPEPGRACPIVGGQLVIAQSGANARLVDSAARVPTAWIRYGNRFVPSRRASP